MTSSSDTMLVPPGDWRVDATRSSVAFTVRRRGLRALRGRFREAVGDVVVKAGHARASGTVRVASIDTGNDERDGHLLAPSFFGADRYPEMAFHSHEIIRTEEGTWRICGDLTIRDHERPVELIATLPSAGDRLLVRGELDRRDFGLTWNRAVEASGVVGTLVGIELDLVLVPARGGTLRAPARGQDDGADRGQAGLAAAGGASPA